MDSRIAWIADYFFKNEKVNFIFARTYYPAIQLSTFGVVPGGLQGRDCRCGGARPSLWFPAQACPQWKRGPALPDGPDGVEGQSLPPVETGGLPPDGRALSSPHDLLSGLTASHAGSWTEYPCPSQLPREIQERKAAMTDRTNSTAHRWDPTRPGRRTAQG